VNFFIVTYFIARNCDDTKENQPRSGHGVMNPYRLHGKEQNANSRAIHTTVRNPYKKTNVNFKEGCPREVMFCMINRTSCIFMIYVYMRPHSPLHLQLGKGGHENWSSPLDGLQ